MDTGPKSSSKKSTKNNHNSEGSKRNKISSYNRTIKHT